MLVDHIHHAGDVYSLGTGQTVLAGRAETHVLAGEFLHGDFELVSLVGGEGHLMVVSYGGGNVVRACNATENGVDVFVAGEIAVCRLDDVIEDQGLFDSGLEDG